MLARSFLQLFRFKKHINSSLKSVFLPLSRSKFFNIPLFFRRAPPPNARSKKVCNLSIIYERIRLFKQKIEGLRSGQGNRLY
jgi:hypothetical protein